MFHEKRHDFGGGGDEGGRRQGEVKFGLSVYSGEESAGFAEDEGAGGDIPVFDGAADESVAASAREPCEVQDGGAGSADRGDMGGDLVEQGPHAGVGDLSAGEDEGVGGRRDG